VQEGLQILFQRAHEAEQKVKHVSLRVMALRARIQARRAQLEVKQSRLQQCRKALHEQDVLLSSVEISVEDAKDEIETMRRAHVVAAGSLMDRQAREMQALQGVLPVRISGVAKSSRKVMQVYSRPRTL
jgi:chromosome segregation ATPase